MAGKQYEVRVPFERVDKRTGDVTSYGIGDPYAGTDVDDLLDGRRHGNTHGPLIREKAPAADTSSKEK